MCSMMKPDMSDLLAPSQLGFGVRGGIELQSSNPCCQAYYIHHLLPGYAVVKFDFKNPFNLVCRDRMLKAVWDLSPQIYQFVYSAYSAPSSLF